MGNVIELGEFRITRKQHSYIKPGCKHFRFTIDSVGDVITCDDCNMQITPMWALTLLTDSYNKEMNRLGREREAQKVVESKTLHLKAAQKVESAWRSQKMVPVCPHCREAIFAEDGLGGSMTNKVMALRRRENQRAKRIAEREAAKGKAATEPPAGP